MGVPYLLLYLDYFSPLTSGQPSIKPGFHISLSAADCWLAGDGSSNHIRWNGVHSMDLLWSCSALMIYRHQASSQRTSLPAIRFQLWQMLFPVQYLTRIFPSSELFECIYLMAELSASIWPTPPMTPDSSHGPLLLVRPPTPCMASYSSCGITTLQIPPFHCRSWSQMIQQGLPTHLSSWVRRRNSSF